MSMEPAAPAPDPAPRRGHRLWFPISVGVLAVLGWITLQFLTDVDRNIRLLLTLLVGVLAGVLVLVWFVVLSRFSWWLRLVVVAVLALAVYGLRQAVRFDGTVDGRGLPRLAWKWSAPPERVYASPAPTAPAPTAAAPRSIPAGLRDVPQFFGPDRDGVVRGAGLARDWSVSPPRELWRQPIGAGWSAYAVVEGRAYTQEQRGEEEWVSCYDPLSGALIWSHRRPTRFYQWQAGEGPHATPTVVGGRVFAYGANGSLDCLDAETGTRVWTRSVLEENGLRNLEWGVSASPLVYDDFVVVTGAEGAGPTVLAYDRETGEPRWRSGTDRASYASPILATLAGQRVVLSFNAATLTAHHPTNGTALLEQRWGLDKPPKAAQPVVIGSDRVFVTAGYGMGCELFQARAGADGVLTLTSLWKNVRMKAQFNGVAVRDGFFYGLDDGLLACVEVETGQRRWKDGRYGSGQSLLVDDLILVQTERGEVVLAEANPEAFRELGRIAALSSKTWNHPTLAGRYLLVRNDREAVCYELPLAEGSGAVSTVSPAEGSVAGPPHPR